MSVRCSYCNNKYKSKFIEIPEFIGGYINGYWFCKDCLEYGFKQKSNSESDRILKLSQFAEKRKDKDIKF